METFFMNLLRISGVATIVVLLVILITPITQKKYSNSWRYWLWLVLCFALILPVNLQFTKPMVTISSTDIKKIPIAQKSTILPKKYNNVYEDIVKIKETTTPVKYVNKKEKNNSINLLEGLMLLWGIGAILYFSLNIIWYLKYVRENRIWSYKSTDKNINEIFADIKKSMNVNSNIRLRIFENINSPMLVGVLNPTVMLPVGDFKEEELKHIFAHELAHYKRFDIWFKMLFLIARSMHWFNPFVYVMGKMLSADIELCCDEYAIKNYTNTSREEYAQTIVNIMKLKRNKGLILTTNFNGGKSFMKKRVKTLINPRRTKRGLTIFVGVMVFAFLLQGLVGGKSVEKIDDEKIITNEVDKEVFDTFESSDIDFSGVKYISSEKERNLKLEQAVAKAEFEEYYSEDEYPEYRYLYNYVDLNGDGKDEVFAVLMGSYFSGTGGSTGIIFEQDGDKYKAISTFSLVRTPIVISDEKTNGWNDIIMQVSGGGHPLSYNVLKFDGKKYPANPSMQPEVEKGTKVTGLGIMADKITPDTGIKYPEASQESTSTFQYNASEENVKLYEAAYNEVVKNFDFIPNKERFSDDNIIDMGDYNSVVLLNDKGSITAWVDKKSNIVFRMNAYNYALEKFAEKNADKVKDSKNLIEVEEYMFSLDPVSEKKAREAVNNFVKNSSLKDVELKDIKFEYIFNSKNKEFYVFEYRYKNDQGEEETAFIKYSTLLQEVTEITK